MEKFLELQEKAQQYIKNAEHGITFTYPLVKENKVLLSVVNNLFLACTNGIGSILHYERLYKRVPLFEENFEEKYRLMRSRVLERYNLDPDYLKLVRDLKETIIAHNQSPIEFSRGGKLVICNDNYELKEVSVESLKKTLGKTKLFIDEVIHITKKQVM